MTHGARSAFPPQQVQNQHFLHQNHMAQQQVQSKDTPPRFGKKGLHADEVPGRGLTIRRPEEPPRFPLVFLSLIFLLLLLFFNLVAGAADEGVASSPDAFGVFGRC